LFSAGEEMVDDAGMCQRFMFGMMMMMMMIVLD